MIYDITNLGFFDKDPIALVNLVKCYHMVNLFINTQIEDIIMDTDGLLGVRMPSNADDIERVRQGLAELSNHDIELDRFDPLTGVKWFKFEGELWLKKN